MKNIFRERQFNKKLRKVTNLWSHAIAACAYDRQLEKDARIINDNKMALIELTDGVMQSLNALIKMYPEKRDIVEEIKKYIYIENSNYINKEVEAE